MYSAIVPFVRMNFAGRCGQYTIGFREIAAICSRTRCIRHCRAYLVALTLLPLGTKNTLVDFMKIHIIIIFSQSGIPGIRRLHETLQITRPNWCFWSPESPFLRNSSFFAKFQLSTQHALRAKSANERKTGIRRRGGMRKC